MNARSCWQVEPIVEERKKLNIEIQAHLPQVGATGQAAARFWQAEDFTRVGRGLIDGQHGREV